MAPPATLTGQDVGEAEGALTALLNQVLARSDTGITRTQYLALRVLALRGPVPSPAALHDHLADQPQVGLDRAQVAELFEGLEARGLVTGSAPDGPGPPGSPPRAPPSTPSWPTPSPPPPGASTPASTPTTWPPPTGSWPRSPSAPTASATSPEVPARLPRFRRCRRPRAD
jgi:hypothetical protein